MAATFTAPAQAASKTADFYKLKAIWQSTEKNRPRRGQHRYTQPSCGSCPGRGSSTGRQGPVARVDIITENVHPLLVNQRLSQVTVSTADF